MKKICVAVFLIFAVSCAYLSKSKEVWIKNEQNETLYIRVDGADNASEKKLVFIQHGLASNMGHKAVQAAKKAFLDNHYTVVTFDDRYSLGNSGNNVQFVSLKSFEKDLDTVIAWAKKQSFYSEPFALAGHSLGGASVLQYGADHPNQVNLLVPITPLISGKLWEKSCMENMEEFCKAWKQHGSFEYIDEKSHKTAIIPYKVITESKSYNAYALAPKITAKTLIIAGEKDNVINKDEVEKLAKSLNAESKAAVISKSGHNFENGKNQAELYQTIKDFIK